MEETYTHGHQEPVLRSHRWRTAANSAAYLLPELRPGQDLLDVGCGPGSITAELAGLVAPGRVTGLDRSSEVIAEARSSHPGVEFVTGSAYRMGLPDASFDVVHAHQLLQHLADPVAALTEMGRVLRPGGVLAVRESDYGAFVWEPPDERLDRWREVYRSVCRANGADPDMGRALPSAVRAAGFADLRVSSSTWTFASDADRRWWCDLWADRTVGSSFAEQAVAYGLSEPAELAGLSRGWRDWAGRPDAVFVVLHVEVLGRRPA